MASRKDISRLFERLSARYGYLWNSQMQTPDHAKATADEWYGELKEFDAGQVMDALEAWADDHPPTLPKFKRACMEVEKATRGLPTLDMVDAALAEIVARVSSDQWPVMMPPGPRDAARWLREHVLDRHHAEESPRRNRSGESWIWPYKDRCILNARMFLSMPSEHQAYILAAREDGVMWRGDDFDFFRRVYDETMRMVDMGPDAYRKEAIKRLRELSVKSAA